MMHNGEEAKYYNKEFNFDQLYYQQFEEKDQGTKLALPDTEDGTYVIQDAGTKKMYIHFAKKE